VNEAVQQVARLARVRDEDLAGIGSGPAAQELLGRLTSQPVEVEVDVQRARRPRARLALAACGVVAMTGALVVGPSLLGGTGAATSYANSAIEVTRVDGVYVARIKDPLADHERYAEAFRAVGLDVDIELVPVAPARVGQLLETGSGGSSGEVSTELVSTGPAPVDCSLQPAACTMIVRISDDTGGDVHYKLGRAAAPGEAYDDPGFPGPPKPSGN
jgi:hypothetical protein